MSLLTYMIGNGQYNKAPFILMGLVVLILLKELSSFKRVKSIIFAQKWFVVKAIVAYILGKYILFPFLYAIFPVSSSPVEMVSNYCGIIFLIVVGLRAFSVFNKVLPTVKNWHYLAPLISLIASKLLF